MSLKRIGGFSSLCLSFFLVMLDTTLIPFLYPVLISHFGLSVTEAAAVNNYYLIAYAGTLLLGGKFGDFSNRKKVFLTGILLLAIGALFAVITGLYAMLLFGRIVMGVGAGLITPQSMAFISYLFEEKERGPAFGAWAAVAGLGTALGPVVAKLSDAARFWELAFWINVILAMGAFIIAALTLENIPQRGGFTIRKILVPMLVGIATMTLLFDAQILSSSSHAGERFYVLLLIAVLLGTGAWLLVKYGKFPAIIQLEKVELRAYISAVLGSACLGGGLTAYYLPLSLSFEYVWRFSEITTIFLLILSSLMNSIFGLLAGSWSNKWGRKKLIIYGMTIFGAACFLLGLFSLFSEIEAPFEISAVAFLVSLVGVGAGLAFGPLANSSMASVAGEVMGEAAAFYNWMRQVFSAAGGVIVAFTISFILNGQDYLNLKITGYSSLVGFSVAGVLLLAGTFISKGVKNDY